MKKMLLSFLLLTSLSGIAQTLNDYQYFIVPVRFNFMSEDNQYRLNTFTKLKLNELGFVAYYENTVPEELTSEKCDKVFVYVEKVSSTFTVKLKIVFKDCWGKVLYTSEIGKGRDKEYAKGYPQALDEAFKSIASFGYKYNGNMKFRADKPPVKVTPIAKTEMVTQQSVTTTSENPENQLFAQPTANGFQLVDKSPKIVYRLVKTSQPDYYMATGDNKQGVIYLRDGEWIFDYYNEEKLVSEKLSIKF